jgi:hypothetical protein
MFGFLWFGSAPFAGFLPSSSVQLDLAIAVDTDSLSLAATVDSASVSLTPSRSATLTLLPEN